MGYSQIQLINWLLMGSELEGCSTTELGLFGIMTRFTNQPV